MDVDRGLDRVYVRRTQQGKHLFVQGRRHACGTEGDAVFGPHDAAAPLGERVGVPGCEGQWGIAEVFQAGQRRTWAQGEWRGLVCLDVRANRARGRISRRAKCAYLGERLVCLDVRGAACIQAGQLLHLQGPRPLDIWAI